MNLIGTVISYLPQVATGSVDRLALLWDMGTGQVTSILEGHVGEVHSCTFKPGSGTLLATGSADGTVSLWSEVWTWCGC